MSHLPYPQPRDEYCKYGNKHPNGVLCGQCRADIEKREQERIRKKAEKEANAKKRKELWDSIIWLDTDNKDDKRVE